MSAAKAPSRRDRRRLQGRVNRLQELFKLGRLSKAQAAERFRKLGGMVLDGGPR